MRVFASALIALLSIVDLVWSQGSAPPAAQAAELPTFRPVLIGQGPNALINRIDERDVVGKGQKDALIMFMCYDHQPVDAIYYGTVTFRVVNGKPRLRIFSNQEGDELEKEHDFIGPQPFFGNGSGFTGFHYPQLESTRLEVDGMVELKMKIDATGNLQEINVVSEKPPLLGFGDAALKDLKDAKFIPAFRDGKPVECEITLPVFYKAAGF